MPFQFLEKKTIFRGSHLFLLKSVRPSELYYGAGHLHIARAQAPAFLVKCLLTRTVWEQALGMTSESVEENCVGTSIGYDL